MHGLAIPVQEHHTVECIYRVVRQFLEGLLGNVLKHTLVSVAKDAARNMTGRLSGAVTRFERDTFPSFFRVWCGAHQLDLIIQELMAGQLQDTFRAPLTTLIAHLRPQYALRQEMGSKCATVAEIRWLLLRYVANWISFYRGKVI